MTTSNKMMFIQQTILS